MTDNEDRIEREHMFKPQVTPAERAERHNLPADQVVVLGHISQFRPPIASEPVRIVVPPGVVPTEAEVEEILANLTGDEDVS